MYIGQKYFTCLFALILLRYFLIVGDSFENVTLCGVRIFFQNFGWFDLFLLTSRFWWAFVKRFKYLVYFADWFCIADSFSDMFKCFSPVCFNMIEEAYITKCGHSFWYVFSLCILIMCSCNRCAEKNKRNISATEICTLMKHSHIIYAGISNVFFEIIPTSFSVCKLHEWVNVF